jgi:hypothetical protein
MVSIAVDNKVSDTMGPPPPTRPSAKIFRSIFDVESDMDISSSDDNESGRRLLEFQQRWTERRTVLLFPSKMEKTQT